MVDGDVPVSMFQWMRKRYEDKDILNRRSMQEPWLSSALPSAVNDSSTSGIGVFTPDGLKIRCLLKNVMSLLSSERELQLLEELALVEWDVVLLNETWKGSREEIWTTPDGHMFLGSGGSAGSKGVAILLHRRWVKCFESFHPVNERLCALDVIMVGRRLRFIAVYMFTSWHADEQVDMLYSVMSDILARARKQKRFSLVFGDFNAVVGPS